MIFVYPEKSNSCGMRWKPFLLTTEAGLIEIVMTCMKGSMMDSATTIAMA